MMMILNRPIIETVNSDIKYFRKKLNSYISHRIKLNKEVKDLKANKTAENIDLIYRRMTEIDSLTKTIARWERILNYLVSYAESLKDKGSKK